MTLPALDVRACAIAAGAKAHEAAPILKACAEGSSHDVHAVLAAAAALYLDTDVAIANAIVIAFRPCLLELMARVFERAEAVHAMARYVGAFEEVYPMTEAFLARHFAHGLPHDEAHLLARWRLVRAAPTLARHLHWPSSDLYKLFVAREHPPSLRQLALATYVLQEQLAPAAQEALEKAWIEQDAYVHVDGEHVLLSTLPLHEQSRIESLWSACLQPWPVSPAPLCLDASMLSPSLCMLGTMVMPASPVLPTTVFVETTSAQRAMRDVLLHTSLRLPVLVSGPASSGKTHLLTYLAHQLSQAPAGMPPYLVIPLGDQSGVDAKALLGSYVSSSTRPGTFEYVEGALTRAVRAGLWVILEDIDKASSDVLSVLAPLAEALGPTKSVGARPVLDLGARGTVEAAPGFTLLATRTTRTGAPKPSFLSSEHWGYVALAPPTRDDISRIVQGRYPRLAQWPSQEWACILQAWEAVVQCTASTSSAVRTPSLRELMQWCARLDARAEPGLLHSPVVQDAVFLDGCDVFLASLPTMGPVGRAMLHALADALQVSEERATYAWHERVPDLALAHAGQVRVGRITLDRLVPGAPTLQRYALTRPALTCMERVAACIAHAEPALLVGETGTGKTTLVQMLATLVGQPLTVVNLSQQTESGDLLGAYKPLDPKMQAADLHNAWSRLFEQTFSVKRNAAYVEAERKAFLQGKWARLAKLWSESCKMAQNELAQSTSTRKKRRTDGTLESAWASLAERIQSFAALFATRKRHFAFSFVEGPLVRALREGHWILLDEINLASPETLDCLAPLLQSRESSLVLTERGDLTPIPRHPQFRLFACMNPATDVGKRDLAPSIRARFTELYVPSPDSDKEALMSIVSQYIGQEAVGDRSAILDVAEWYTDLRRLAAQHAIADGANQRPHYSIRTLARALTFAATLAPTYGLRRALAEGVEMAFGMLLDAPSTAVFQQRLQTHLLARAKDRRVARTFVPPSPGPSYVSLGAFWLETGPLPLDEAPSYVLTPSVEAKVSALARALVTRQSPVLIQGPTSAGKTSAVEYVARRTGHRFVRINNHEHTDVQEYLGSYASNAEGQLVYTEGLLVTALRRGDWLVLDELNLAPTDVLEALNRLLDDNRELLVPETGEVIRPHPHFMLFATQNPPGAYAGRKMLSRAFRNRFVELHFDDVPQNELATILTRRCEIAPSYAEKIVQVFTELQRRRQSERVFDKQAFATLRDLFRWGMRGAVGYQQLAETGYMLLAERTRHPRDRATVQAVLQEVMRVRIDPTTLYDASNETLQAQVGADLLQRLRHAAATHKIVWTSAMQRLVCLTAVALQGKEPVLLVGETGAGKTSVCDILSTAMGRRLHSFNCHQNTDSADLLGGQRPLRDRAQRAAAARSAAQEVLGEALPTTMTLDDVAARLQAVKTTPPREAWTSAWQQVQQAQALFTWCDGPLVEAMRQGEHMLLDEISLADDSVLERLNSVLEKERTLVLAEKAGTDVIVSATDGFQVIATMNPGGDYGKKELSPALRNRFTEIFVPPVDAPSDQAAIVNALLPSTLHVWTEQMLAFVRWFSQQLGGYEHTGLGVRDLMGWAQFMHDVCARDVLPAPLAFAHGASLTIIDSLGALPATAAMVDSSLQALRAKCHAHVASQIAPTPWDPTDPSLRHVRETSHALCIGPFSMHYGPVARTTPTFSLDAPTTADNALRVLRACEIRARSVLLEGSPGAGKTSLIASLAALTGHELVRINLSEQTELVDLFGAELPVEHGRAGEFAWRPAAFLDAMQRGAWVLLDEMNLASQTVLEGLNSCLDHRGSVYVAEIGRTFTKHPEFRLFAAQNPQHQGGARKGLPKSLLNRFIKVYVEPLQAADIRVICGQLYPAMAPHLDALVRFNDALHTATQAQELGRHGAPWEFNLRDLLRWLQLMHASLGTPTDDPVATLSCLYLARFRTPKDRAYAASLFASCFGREPTRATRTPSVVLSPSTALAGAVLLPRTGLRLPRGYTLVPSQQACLEGMAASVRLGLLTILVGHAGTGKSSLVHTMAAMMSRRLEEVRLSAASDTMDVLGSFEQRDPSHQKKDVLRQVDAFLDQLQLAALTPTSSYAADAASLLDTLAACRTAMHDQPEVLQTLVPYLADAEAHTLSALLAQLHDASQGAAAGQFEWVDGPLLRAAKQGHWLLLDNANLCAASVLDRLNSLFEPNGSLVLSERGMVDEGRVPHIVPHPAFRVFMTVDPRYGELSRAMRNRGMELWLESVEIEHVAPLARTMPQAAGTLLERAVTSHASRRGWMEQPMSSMITPCVQVALAQPILAAPALRITALLASCWTEPSLREAVAIYAKQALWPCERALVAATLSLDTTASSPPRLLASDSDVQEVCPNDPRRIDALAHLHDTLHASQLAWQVRIEQMQKRIADVGEDTLYARARTDRALPPMLRGIPTLLPSALAWLATLPPMDATISVIDRCLDTLSMVWEACLPTEADYSLLHFLLRTLRALWLELQATTSLPSALLSTLRPMYTPSSRQGGAAMASVWHRALPAIPAEAQTLLAQLAHHLDRLMPPTHARTALEVLTTLHVWSSSWTDAHAQELTQVVHAMMALEAAPTQPAWPYVRRVLPVLQWYLLAEEPSQAPVAPLEPRLGAVLRAMTEHQVVPVLWLVAAQWRAWAPRKACPVWMSLQPAHALWYIDGAFQVEALGAQTLTQAVLAPNVLEAVQEERIGLASWPSYESHLRALSSCIATALVPAQPSRVSHLRTLLGAFALDMTQALHHALSQLAWPEGQDVMQALGSALHTSEPQMYVDALAAVQAKLEQDTALHSALQAWLTWLREAHACLTSTATPAQLAHAWVHLALYTLHVYVPDMPLDPVAEVHAQHAWYAHTQSQLDARLQVEGAVAQMRTGGASHAVLDELRTAMAHVATQQANATAARVHRASDPVLLARWHTEVTGLLTDTLSTAKLDRLLTRLASPTETALAEETSLQASVYAFEQRLRRQYASMSDLTAPVHTALEQLRLGLRLAVPSKHVSPRIAHWLSSTMQTPTSAAAHAIAVHATDARAKSTALAELLAALASAAYDAHITQTPPSPSTIATLYEQLYVLWAAHREAEREKAEAEARVFTFKGEDATEEQARLAAEMQAMFPVYDDVLETTTTATTTTRTSPNKAPTINAQVLTSIHDLHTCLFPSTMPWTTKRVMADAPSMFVQHTDTLMRLYSTYAARMPADLDKGSAYQLARIARRLAPPAEARNFYHDAQPAELAKMGPLLDALQSHVTTLLGQMPEQVQLQQLQERCERVQQLDMASPIAKGLAAIELLLTHVDDWETYASSATSLRTHATALTNLVIEWRRLELHSWALLLDNEAACEEEGVSPWFFSLYEALTRASDSTTISDLVSLLDTYVRGSTVGQLAARLRLLDTLSVFIQPQGDISRVLHHIAAYYAQFLPAVEAHLQQQRSLLERQIQDYVRLASWKDVNVYALKQSAQKTHQYLHKSLRKWREMLRAPADPLLALKADARPNVLVRAMMGPVSASWRPVTASLPVLVARPVRNDTALHFQDVRKTLRHVHTLCESHIMPQMDTEHWSDVSDLATTILETADELAQQTPALANEGNAKKLKSLATQKRRAWSDLLKELRRWGLSPFLSAEVLAQNRDPVWIYGAPMIKREETLGTDAMDQYHAAMLAQVERLRLAAQAPQGDVPDLARGVAFVEHALHWALVTRRRWAPMYESVQALGQMVQRLCTLTGPLYCLSSHDVQGVQVRINHMARTIDALQEAMATMTTQAQMWSTNTPTLQDWPPLLERLRASRAALQGLLETWNATHMWLATEADHAMLQESTAALQATLQVLRATAHAAPSMQLITIPICAWLEPGCEAMVWSATRAEGDIQSHTDQVCSSVLVILQDMKALPPQAPRGEVVPDQFVPDEMSRLQTIHRILKPQKVVEALRACVANAGSDTTSTQCMATLAQFLKPYLDLAVAHTMSMSRWYRAWMRLCLVLSVIMTTLATKGFCQPPEEDDADDDAEGDGGEQLEGGTGLGDGSGAKDVSDTLQVDEMMEELQNEEQDQDQGEETQGEDKAREMDDMDGDVHSVDGEREEEQGDDGEEQEEQEPQDEVGDVDPLDPDAVDEKMWANEPETEQQGESEAAGGAQEDREQAGDRSEQPDEAGNEQEGDEQQGDQESGETNEEEAEPELEDVPDKTDGLGRDLDQEAQEEDMQLGDDLDIQSGDEKEEGDDEMDLSSDGEHQNELDDGASDSMDEREHDDTPITAEPDKTTTEDAGDADADVDAEDEEQDRAEDTEKAEGEDDPVDDDKEKENQAEAEPENEEASQPAGTRPESMEKKPLSQPSEQHRLMPSTDTTMEDDTTTHEGGGEDTGGAAGEQEQASGEADKMDGSSTAQASGAPQDGDAAGAENDAENAEARPNPVQSLGDSLEQFRRDVEQIREATQHEGEQHQEEDGVPEAGDVEHIAQDEQAEAQALGVADEQQAQAMKSLSMEDTEAQETAVPMDEESDMAPPEPSAEPTEDKQPPEGAGQPSHGAQEGALSASDVRRNMADHTEEGTMPATDEEHMEPMDDEAREEAESQTVEALAAFRASEMDIDKAAELWRSYVGLTTDLAFGLCEQLRLILAPSLATRLNGDYRTGKRLNMRKIIPFIASDFAKDKIWLRRTKPSSREYQVLLAIDDSKSMADSRNIHLAYETLALVAGALTRLEVGDIGICRFGSRMDMLHDFGTTSFSDRHGGHILSQLQFQQTNTDMYALLQQSMSVLQEARQRASASAADLWQLEIIISDGVCQDHERLKALLRRATEERIMLVFVVVDAGAGAENKELQPGEAPRSSILSMNQVNYHTDAAGKLQLEMKRYIDTFPFDYYVIVRDVQSLPHVLATTLRQWAERIRDA